VLIRDLPCEAGTPIMANKMETPFAVPDGGYDIERIVDQSVHMVTGVIGRIGSSACGISPLVRRYDEIARLPTACTWAFQKNLDTPKPCSMTTSGA
jgi:hypothetical protein